MTNRISSAEQAIEALMKLKSRSVPVRVRFSWLYASFSFEGYVTELDNLTLRIEGTGVGGVAAPELVLGTLAASSFAGETGEDDSGAFVRLLITRPASSDKEIDLYRFLIEGEWQPEALQRPRPN